MLFDVSTFDGQLYVPAAWWIGTFLWFVALILGDLWLNRRSKNSFSLKTAVIRSVIWISLGLLLGAVIWWHFGAEAGGRYFAGFLIEKSLSADNIFVWGVILTYFAVPKRYHYRVLVWGILGAIVFRSLFVVAGLEILNLFEPALLALGGLLLYMSWRLLRSGGDTVFDPHTSGTVRFVRHILPVSKRDHDGALFAKERGRVVVTMLFFTICVIELTDVLFAIDSIPAAIAVVRDPYIVLASNIAAVLGLRALYFVYERLKDRFYLLNKALALILSVIGLTLFLEPPSILGVPWFGFALPPEYSIAFVLSVLVIAIAGSLLWPKGKKGANG